MDEEILEAIHKVRNKVILVEGKKDKRALEILGCRKVLTLEDKALFEVVESINTKEIVLLTDLDSEGKKLYSQLKRMFSQRGVLIDNHLRLILFKHKVSHIESLHE
ncbi:MAG: toprim domain-containing protein [bacterium]|nr:toprim domain-containing protein [bacterium]